MLGSSQQNVKSEESDAFLAHILFWLSQTNYHDSRAFLEGNHEVLLRPQANIALSFLTEAARSYPDEFQHLAEALLDSDTAINDLLEEVKLAHLLLDDIRVRSRSLDIIQAIREAYVNRYGGFVLDVPLWLQEIGNKIIDFDYQEDQEQTTKAHLDLLQDAISRAEKDPDVPEEMIAWLHVHRSFAIASSADTYKASAYTAAIQARKAALKIYTKERYPLQWASNQYRLGILYRLLHPHRSEYNYLKDAIASFEAALQVYTFDAFPENWAQIHKSLVGAYHMRMESEQKNYAEQIITHCEAALQVYNRASHPSEWASLQGYLGDAYMKYLAGDRGENIDRAIDHYKAALLVQKHEGSEAEIWAETQGSLGEAYLERIRGDRRENIERAITCFRFALQVFMRTGERKSWAGMKLSLGNAYLFRVQGERMDNIETAIIHLDSALQGFTRDTSPLEWARVQNSLGFAYLWRLRDERAANVERAIAHFTAALQCYKPITTPLDWAMTQMNQGTAYLFRLHGNSAENLGLAIWCYREALETYKREGLRAEAAKVQSNLGLLYQQLSLLVPRDYLNRSITSCISALEVYTREAFPMEWARTQCILGGTFLFSSLIEDRDSLEEAIRCFNDALQVYTYESNPLEWAYAQWQLGSTYFLHTTGDRNDNLERSAAAYLQALRVFTPEAFTREYRQVQIALANAEVARGHPEAAHEAYLAAQEAEEYLVLMGMGTTGRDTILTEREVRSAIHHGMLLARMGRAEAAAVVIERGRTYGMAEAFALDAADPNRISDPRLRARYLQARQRFLDAQASMNTQAPFAPGVTPDIVPYDFRAISGEASQSPRRESLDRIEGYRQAQIAFNAVVDDIRRSQNLDDFLQDTLDHKTILQAAACGGQGHALLYLAAAPEGGMAIAAISGQPDQHIPGHFSFLELPALTYQAVLDLVLSTINITGSQSTTTHAVPLGLDPIVSPLYGPSSASPPKVTGGFLWAQEGSGLLPLLLDWNGSSLRDKGVSLHKACTKMGHTSTLYLAIQEVSAIPKLTTIIDKPLSLLNTTEMANLKATFGHSFLQFELERCLSFLANAAMCDVAYWLHQQRITSVTLIPCGWLAAFPLAAVEVLPGKTFGDLVTTSVAPSARSLLHNEKREQARSGVYALGDPHPTDQILKWGEAETHTVAKLARLHGIPTHVKVQEQAKRRWFVDALQQGHVVHASCHGTFIPVNPLESALKLAQGQKLALGEMLSHEVDLRGLRLLILSACETATMDLRRAVDEVHSFATGTLQAGVEAVLASLWAVDDLATYLLIVRFAQEWLSYMDSKPPAKALIDAQQWLRSLTYTDMLAWKADHCLTLTESEKREAGSETPDLDSWQELAQWLDGKKEEANLATVRGHGTRMESGEAEYWIHKKAEQDIADNQTVLDLCPYAHPIFWAGFQINGW